MPRPIQQGLSNSARVLRRAEEHAGSQQRLAQMLGVNPMQLARWLSGKGVPPHEIFVRALQLWVTQEYAGAQPPADTAAGEPEARRPG